MTDNTTAATLSLEGEEVLTLAIEEETLESYEDSLPDAAEPSTAQVHLMPSEDEITLDDEVTRNHELVTETTGDALQPEDFSEDSPTGEELVLDVSTQAARPEAADPAEITGSVETMDIVETVHVVEQPACEKTDQTEKSDISTAVDDGRVVVRHHASDIRRTRSIVLTSLAGTGKVFEQGGSMVTLKTDSVTGEVVLHELNSAQMVLAVDEVVAWERFDSRKQEFVRSAPPESFCSSLLRTGVTGELPALAGVVQQPYMRDDGTICSTPGYDRVSRLYGAFAAPDWPCLEHPTQNDARAALERLEGLLDEFQFVDAVDRAASLSAMLTAAVRPGLATAPMFLTRAHVPGSGKSYLCALITAMASPRRGAPLAFPSSDDECEKVLLAQFRRGSAVIEFDNLTRDLLPYKKLCTALTSERVTGRVLGTSRTLELSTRVLLLANGNNVDPVGDLARRCITIRLDALTERPAERTFTRPDLLEQVRQQRDEYVAAALTVVRAWLVAGMPKAKCAEQGSFNRWSDWCRQPLLWLGHPDPVATMSTAHSEDPERVLLGRLLEIWQARAASGPVMVRDLVAWAAEGSSDTGSGELGLADVLDQIAGDRGGSINRKRLGWWLKAHSGHIVGGRRLQRHPRRANADTWHVVGPA